MRILAFSDSHGFKISIDKILKLHDDVNHILFCGDGENDIVSIQEKYPDKTFDIVRGNCDFNSNFPLTKIVEVENKRILITHGHSFYVKSSLQDLKFYAKQRNINIVIFGHTHNALNLYEDEVYYLNPGSCSMFDASFAIIDINDGNIFVKICEYNKIKFPNFN